MTETQLRTYLDDSLLLVASQQHLQEGLEVTRKTLPAWFPDKVWRDVKQAVAAVDLPKLMLPVYQKYFTEQDGESIILRFTGPTGHAYAEAALRSRLAAVHQGLEGSAADRAAEASASQANVDQLLKAHLATLTPEERAKVQALAVSRSQEIGFKIDDEQNKLVNAKMNQVMHATFVADDAQLKSAQRAYQGKH